ncbi:MAG: hypothetical protein K8L97_09160 [Anaerolineae bacterium]|nr:hypothetical protein [Anaerolineae bacterium]
MPDHIVLVGPPGVPLMAIGEQTAKLLGLPLHSPDGFTDAEWEQFGYNSTADIKAWAEGGAYASYRLHMPLRVHVVGIMLNRAERSLIVLPSNYVVQEEADLLHETKALLDNITHVILLTPSPDVNENALLLDADLVNFPDWSEVNAYWVNNPSNERLAKHIVYTKGKTEEQMRDEILALRQDGAKSDIILIGPKLTGKTTLGRLLADVLHLPQVSLDNLGGQYLPETDFDLASARKAHQEGGIFGWLRYRRPYEAHIVERALQDNRNCVIDFGGGHSVYDDEANFNRVAKALADYPNVVLILPALDKAESIQILKQRFEADVASERKLQRLLVTHPSYEAIKKQVIYTKDKTADELSAAVITIVNGDT